MFVEPCYVQNLVGYGHLAETLQGVRFEPGLMRPYTDRRYRGERFVTINSPDGSGEYDDESGRFVVNEEVLTVHEAEELFDCEVPISNAMTLPKDFWIDLDTKIEGIRLNRLRMYADIAAMATRNVDGMSKTTVEYQAETAWGEAIQDMDGASDTRGDRPSYVLKSMPLPVTHFGASFSQREIAAAKNGGGLDTRAITRGGRVCMEMIEKVTIGTETGMNFGPTSSSDSRYTGSSVNYGATNFPYRVTKTDLNTPTLAAPENIMDDVSEMIETQETNGYFGPYILYHSTPYSKFFRADYFRTGGTAVSRTVRDRVLDLGVQDIRRLDFLTSGYQLILISMDGDVAEAVDGLPITPVQYPSKGGLKQNIEVMAIQAVLWRSPADGVAGIVHGTTS